MKNKKLFRILRIVFYALCFFYLLLKEPNGESSFIICPTRGMFDIDCYLCGMTRAFICAFHCLFLDAINYNPLVIVIYPLFLFASIFFLICYEPGKSKSCSACRLDLE